MMRNRYHLLLCALGVLLLMHSCIAWRFIGHGTEGIDDFKTFPTDTIHAPATPFAFAKAERSVLDTLRLAVERCKEPLTLRQMIDTLDSKAPSAGIVVVRNDTILFEHYRGMVAPDSHTTVFSVTKSVTSLLVGMAIDKGYIRSVKDVVTDYLPELKTEAPEFGRLTIENLLDFLVGRPDILQIHRIALGVLSQRLRGEIEIHGSAQGIRYHQGRSAQVVLRHIRRDASLEISVAGKHARQLDLVGHRMHRR
jgi:hypothetical protein